MLASDRPAPQQPQRPTFTTAIRTVPVYVTAIDSDGHLVTDLSRDDFQVFDDGRPPAAHGVRQSRTGHQHREIMLDMSGSMLGNLPVLRRAAVQMFTRPPADDKARVGGFGDRIVLSERFTNDQDELIRALWFDLAPGGGTPLWGRRQYGDDRALVTDRPARGARAERRQRHRCGTRTPRGDAHGSDDPQSNR